MLKSILTMMRKKFDKRVGIFCSRKLQFWHLILAAYVRETRGEKVPKQSAIGKNMFMSEILKFFVGCDAKNYSICRKFQNKKIKHFSMIFIIFRLVKIFFEFRRRQ